MDKLGFVCELRIISYIKLIEKSKFEAIHIPFNTKSEPMARFLSCVLDNLIKIPIIKSDIYGSNLSIFIHIDRNRFLKFIFIVAIIIIEIECDIKCESVSLFLNLSNFISS
mgnify:CR=1 FL=1